MALAREGKQLTLPVMAEREQLSEALTAKVLNKLRRGGIVIAARGRNGGYELAKEPEALTVAEILESLGRPVVESCYNSVSKDQCPPCPHVENCGIRPVWDFVEKKVMEVLTQISLNEIIKEEKDVWGKMTSLGEPKLPQRGPGAIEERTTCAIFAENR